jgi:hypothetical protein
MGKLQFTLDMGNYLKTQLPASEYTLSFKNENECVHAFKKIVTLLPYKTHKYTEDFCLLGYSAV